MTEIKSTQHLTSDSVVMTSRFNNSVVTSNESSSSTFGKKTYRFTLLEALRKLCICVNDMNGNDAILSSNHEYVLQNLQFRIFPPP